MLDKDALRQELAVWRAAAFEAAPNAAALLPANFPSDIHIAPQTIVAGYMPFRSEIDPLPLMRELKRRGAVLALPHVTSYLPIGSEDSHSVLSFHLCDIDNADHFELNKWGLLEPRADLAVATPTILLVPLLGFDRQSNRIGYGKGFYDRTIAALKSQTSVTTIGLAFAQQEVEQIPTQPHDQRLDWIITQNGAYPTPS
jgi:5-formyltetrahydrofolate cyclo-ligase